MDIQRAKLLEKVTVRTQKIEIDPAQGQEPPISSNLPKCCVCVLCNIKKSHFLATIFLTAGVKITSLKISVFSCERKFKLIYAIMNDLELFHFL